MTFKHRSDRVRDDDSPWCCMSTFQPWTQRQQREAVAVAGPGMMSLWLVQGQGTWTVETDGVITKAGRKGCSNQPLGHVTTPPAQCQGMMGHQDNTPRITWSEGRVSWRSQKECNETTCWMKTKQTPTSFVIKFARTSNLGTGEKERKI